MPALPREEQNRPRHILLLPLPACRISALLIEVPRLAVRIRAPTRARHLAREDPRSNPIDPDLGACERRREHAGQVRERGLGRRVAELTAGARLHGPGDRRHVHDAAGDALGFQRWRFLSARQQREKGHAHEITSRHICPERVLLLLRLAAEEVLGNRSGVIYLRGLVLRKTRVVVLSDAGIVDKKIDALRREARHFCGEPDGLGFLRYVAWESADLARPRAWVIEVDDAGKGVRPPAGDVYRCAILGEGLRYHLAGISYRVLGQSAWLGLTMGSSFDVPNQCRFRNQLLLP